MSSNSSLEELAQTLSRCVAIEAGSGDLEDKGFPGINIPRRKFRIIEESVLAQKDKACGEGRALVAVHKRVIAANVEKAGFCQVEACSMRTVANE